jgi:copper chaperone CopZ
VEEKTVTIPEISCGHCVANIKRELGDVPGVDSVDGDPGSKRLTVRWGPPATWDAIARTLGEAGYPPA